LSSKGSWQHGIDWLNKSATLSQKRAHITNTHQKRIYGSLKTESSGGCIFLQMIRITESDGAHKKLLRQSSPIRSAHSPCDKGINFLANAFAIQ